MPPAPCLILLFLGCALSVAMPQALRLRPSATSTSPFSTRGFANDYQEDKLSTSQLGPSSGQTQYKCPMPILNAPSPFLKNP